MNTTLKSMVVAVGVVTLGGVSFLLYTPQPANRTMLELRDAGIAEGQKFVLECPERLEPSTIARIKRRQPDALRPKQKYGRVARVAVCLRIDGGTGNCFRVTDGGLLAGNDEAEVIVPSLRADVVGVVDDGGADESGEDTSVDDSYQFNTSACRHLTCSQYADMVAAGERPNPYATAFCGALNRLALVTPPCMVPDARLADGGWDDNATGIQCRAAGPYALPDGGARWIGVNVFPREYAVGAECLPVECSVVAGDVPSEWL